MSDPDQPKKVIVTVHSARNLYNTNFFTKMDPYCIVTLGGQEYKTNIDNCASKNPKWDQTFTFSYVGEHTMRFKVMDKDRFSADDYVGMCDVSLGPIIHGTRLYVTELQLSRKEGKEAGYLKVQIEFEPKKNQEKPSSSTPAPATPAPAPVPVPAVVPVPVPAYQPAYPGGYLPPQQYGAPPAYGYAPPAVTPYGYQPSYGYPPQPAYPPQPHQSSHSHKKKKKKKKKSSSSSESD